MEIGSEFWKNSYATKKYIEAQPNSVCLLSGRTALDFIIRDIKNDLRFKKVMIPSYCCNSMIEPFRQNGIDIQFYPVTEEEIYYPENDADAVLLIDFFGYRNPENIKLAIQEKKAGKIVIYDATHKLNELDFPADYLFCSYRKWVYCNFAVAIKRNNAFHLEVPKVTNHIYVHMRNYAAECKKHYIFEKVSNKTEFLRLFAVAEDLLEKDYVGYAGISEYIDMNKLICARRTNAEYLINNLKEIDDVRLWKSHVDVSDTPLFVPILVKNGRRDKLKEYLIQNDIYCPVHWPSSERYEMYGGFYAEELSLICDQRYTEEDMNREITIIEKFFEEI